MPSNMVGRNGDTLDLDYPYFSDDNPEDTYDPVFVDAVVANPPYSQKYEPQKIKDSARFDEYGLPPKSKADYAFLLHGLYHLKTDGVQVIVLPHGVLFRNEESDIRTKLIQKHQIEAVIGLAPNTFFGTSIPTCLVVLKKQREGSDIYFIDASKHFVKDGNKNRLRESDVQKIVDAYKSKQDIEKFARLVPYQEIEENEFNLNISRYINSEPNPEKYDAFGVMNGAIPKEELEEKFGNIWSKFPSLYNNLFKEINDDYVILDAEDIIETINSNSEIEATMSEYNEVIDTFTENLKDHILSNLFDLDLSQIKEEIKEELFSQLEEFSLIDDYVAYQAFYNNWAKNHLDIEILHEDGLDAARQEIEITKLNQKKEEVFDRWEGRIIPFDILQERFLKDKKDRQEALENRKVEIKAELDELVSQLEEEDGNKVLNDNNDAFAIKETKAVLEELFEDIETPELLVLNEYIKLLDQKAKKDQKLEFMDSHEEVDWSKIKKNKDGTVGKKGVNNYLKEVQAGYEFEEDTLGYILANAVRLKNEESEINKELKELNQELQDQSVQITNEFADEEIYELLERKWIDPINQDLKDLMPSLFSSFENRLNETIEKYGENMKDLEEKEAEVDANLKDSLSQLTGSDSSMKAIQDFMGLLGGM